MAEPNPLSGDGQPTGLDLDRFRAALSERLTSYTVRGLAERSHWGRTIVSDIKSGRQLPTSTQLRDLLHAVGADERELAEWEERRKAIGTSSVADPPSVAVPAGTAPSAADVSTWSSRRALLIAGGALVLILLTLAVIVVDKLLTPDQVSPVSSTPTAGPSPSAVSRSPRKEGEITEPATGTRVSSTKGVLLSGTVQSHGAQTVWLVDQDSDGTYTADTTVDQLGDGSWTAEDAPIGDPSDIPSRITILLVRANDSCAAFLRREADTDDSTFGMLPRGCEVLDNVSVTVDRP